MGCCYMIKVFKSNITGFYIIQFWDAVRGSWVLWWSGSRSAADAMQAARAARRFVSGY